eukprot:snap_masked-scaffold_11-processed-gene-2.18-mRNA-1 protein AED:1.00 eAED:1.00 QI:0/-1/0/0/-1/1/1/0/522
MSSFIQELRSQENGRKLDCSYQNFDIQKTPIKVKLTDRKNVKISDVKNFLNKMNERSPARNPKKESFEQNVIEVSSEDDEYLDEYKQEETSDSEVSVEEHKEDEGKVSMNDLGTKIEENYKMRYEELKAENEQLKKKYEVIKAQTNNEYLDKYNWDGSLASAEKIFLELAKKIQLPENEANFEIINDFERFEDIVTKHPDYTARENEKMKAWEMANAASNKEALEEMRKILPKNLLNMSKANLEVHFKGNKRLTRRIYNSRYAFSVLVSTNKELQKAHVVDLRSKFSPNSFDLIELRAFYSCLPETFLADGDGAKAAWKEHIRNMLKEYTEQEDQNKLPKNKQRDSAYSAPKPITRKNTDKKALRPRVGAADLLNSALLKRASTLDAQNSSSVKLRGNLQQRKPNSKTDVPKAKEKILANKNAGLLAALQNRKKIQPVTSDVGSGKNQAHTPKKSLPKLNDGLLAALKQRKTVSTAPPVKCGSSVHRNSEQEKVTHAEIKVERDNTSVADMNRSFLTALRHG